MVLIVVTIDFMCCVIFTSNVALGLDEYSLLSQEFCYMV